MFARRHTSVASVTDFPIPAAVRSALVDIRTVSRLLAQHSLMMGRAEDAQTVAYLADLVRGHADQGLAELDRQPPAKSPPA